MKIQSRIVPVALAVFVLPWIGMFQAVPHYHADTHVPQEILTCTASGPGSFEVHLHSAGDRLTPHPCAVCLAGTSHAAPPASDTTCEIEPESSLRTEQSHDLRSLGHNQLPLLRGPPTTA